MSHERGGCTHIAAVETVRQPAARVCDECVTIGSTWVHLRTCQRWLYCYPDDAMVEY